MVDKINIFFKLRRFGYLLISAVLTFSTMFAQTDEVEAFESKLSTLDGIERVDVLNSLSDLLKRNSYDKSKSYAEEALKISRQIDYHNGEAKALVNLGFAEYIHNDLERAENLYLNALAIFNRV